MARLSRAGSGPVRRRVRQASLRMAAASLGCQDSGPDVLEGVVFRFPSPLRSKDAVPPPAKKDGSKDILDIALLQDIREPHSGALSSAEWPLPDRLARRSMSTVGSAGFCVEIGVGVGADSGSPDMRLYQRLWNAAELLQSPASIRCECKAWINSEALMCFVRCPSCQRT